MRRSLLGKAVVLKLDQEVLGPEHLLIHSGDGLGLVVVAAQQLLANLRSKACAGCDHALAVGAEDLMVDPGLIVIALQGRDRAELAEVAIPLQILG